MATFSTNQVRQFYVAKSYGTNFTNAVAATLGVGKDADNCLFFKYQGADNLMRSDLIPISSITQAKAVKYTAVQRGLLEIILLYISYYK